jgi:hypothetical protein
MTKPQVYKSISDLSFSSVTLLCEIRVRAEKLLTSHDANFPRAWIAFALATMMYSGTIEREVAPNNEDK